MIGILPAAGHAVRMRGIPKAFLPIPGNTVLMGGIIRRMNTVTDSVMCIPNRNLLSASLGAVTECNFMYTIPFETATMSETVLSAQGTCADHNILFGMPDTYIEDESCFRKLATALDNGADVAVGVFHAREGQHTEGGMCVLDYSETLVRQIVDKPDRPVSQWIWGVLAWKPAFWSFIKPEMPHVGFAVDSAIEGGLDVRAVKMDGQYFDCGTPTRYFALIRHLTGG